MKKEEALPLPAEEKEKRSRRREIMLGCKVNLFLGAIALTVTLWQSICVCNIKFVAQRKVKTQRKGGKEQQNLREILQNTTPTTSGGAHTHTYTHKH